MCVVNDGWVRGGGREGAGEVVGMFCTTTYAGISIRLCSNALYGYLYVVSYLCKQRTSPTKTYKSVSDNWIQMQYRRSV